MLLSSKNNNCPGDYRWGYDSPRLRDNHELRSPNAGQHDHLNPREREYLVSLPREMAGDVEGLLLKLALFVRKEFQHGPLPPHVQEALRVLQYLRDMRAVPPPRLY